MEMTYRIESWSVEVRLHSMLNDEDDTDYHFDTEGDARLGVEWLYADHLDKLRGRADVEEIRAEPDPHSGSWKLQEVYGKKITWWQRTLRGLVARKDYFSVRHHILQRTVIGRDPATATLNKEQEHG